MPLPFVSPSLLKVSATGNDFLLLDLTNPSIKTAWEKRYFATHSRGQWVRRWCNRYEGLGADGMVFLEADPQADFAWDFYNSDGGTAEMCGNAARAVSLYMHQVRHKTEFTFRTLAGMVQGEVRGPDDIEVRLPALKELVKGTDYDFVRPGVPHAVIQVVGLNDRNRLREQAMRTKREPRFAGEGVNVTFWTPISEGVIGSVTFERGVEDFTLSCGTGAIAAAAAVAGAKPDRPVEVQVPGGRLSVIWRDGHPHLRGPAKIVAQMQVFDAPGGPHVD